MSETQTKTSRECALIAARAADERKATDIMVIEVGSLIDVTDYFVIVTAANTPQVEAILESKKHVITPGKFLTMAPLLLMCFSLKHANIIVSKRCGTMLLLLTWQKRALNTPNIQSVLSV